MNILLKSISNYTVSLAMSLRHFHKCLLLSYKLIILCWVFSASISYANSPSILFITQNNKPFTQQVLNSITSQSALSAYQNQVINYNELDTSIIQNYDLIVTLGSQPAKAVLNLNIKKPLLSLLITEQAFTAFREQYQNRPSWSVLVIDQPLQRQIMLGRFLLGADKTFGFLLGPYSSKQLLLLTDIAEEMNLNIAVEHIDYDAVLIPSIKSLINSSDMIVSLPDSVTFNKTTIRGILLLSYRNNIPVIGFSNSYVKSGALAAVYSTPKQIGLYASEIIVDFINSRDFKKILYYPGYYSISTNSQVARTLGISIKSDIELLDMIQNFERAK